jgi:addiction module RelE/StbE family toxin
MRVNYQKSFLKALDKLPTAIEEKFYIRLELFLENASHPLLNNHSVDAAYPGCRSINVTGDYRAIFRVEGNLVIFLHIGTHSQLYK